MKDLNEVNFSSRINRSKIVTDSVNDEIMGAWLNFIYFIHSFHVYELGWRGASFIYFHDGVVIQFFLLCRWPRIE